MIIKFIIGGVATVLVLLLLWISITISIKRLRDANVSAWWYLLVLIPYLGAFIIFIMNAFLPSVEEGNKYCKSKNNLSDKTVLKLYIVLLVPIAMVVLAIVVPKIVNYQSEDEIIENISKKAEKAFLEKDYSTVIKLYQNLADKGRTYVGFRLGYAYGQVGNIDNAIKYYHEYLELMPSSEHTMRNLGIEYSRNKDYINSEKWLKKAFDIFLNKAESGDKEAMKWLAIMYQNGEGVELDLNKFQYCNEKSKGNTIDNSNQNFTLKVNVTPPDARVYITNIKPKYYDGIALKEGSYALKIKKDGYLTEERIIDLFDNLVMNISLRKNQNNAISRELSKVDTFVYHNNKIVVKYKLSDSFSSSVIFHYNKMDKNKSATRNKNAILMQSCFLSEMKGNNFLIRDDGIRLATDKYFKKFPNQDIHVQINIKEIKDLKITKKIIQNCLID